MKRVNLFLLLFLFGLTACNIPGGGGVTVAPPSPVAATTQPPATQPPAPATQTSAPTNAPASTATTAPQPAATNTQAPTGQTPPEAIAILEPGPGSRVVSPLRVSGVADPTFEQSLAITILLADGTELVTTNTQIGADVGQRGPYLVEVPFSVSQEQPGFIQVYAISAKDGGVTHLSSVVVTLAPSGAADIRPASEGPEQIQILSPAAGTAISGGVVHVEGFGLATFEQTLLVELLDEGGAVLGSAPVTVAAPDLGQPGSFSVDLPYRLTTSITAARLQVRDISPAHGKDTHLSSVELTLQP